jgi:hypothetical protein
MDATEAASEAPPERVPEPVRASLSRLVRAANLRPASVQWAPPESPAPVWLAPRASGQVVPECRRRPMRARAGR